jgi:hypothetical protein
MVFGLYHGTGACGVFAAGWHDKEYEKNVRRQFSHAMITPKIVLFRFTAG